MTASERSLVNDYIIMCKFLDEFLERLNEYENLPWHKKLFACRPHMNYMPSFCLPEHLQKEASRIRKLEQL